MATCAAVAVLYALAALGIAVWTRDGGPLAVRWAWVALFLDLAVLGSLTLLTGVETPQSWTSDVLTTGFLLVPVLAAAQLRPLVCAAVVVPAVAVYLLAGIATRTANEEPWTSLLLRTLVMAGVAGGCVALSFIQRSRVSTIGRLVRARTDLLAELTALERRERRALSEQLHDGALQYVLAARQDLDDARDTGAPEAFDRLEQALVESSRLLRTTVAELHPAVLERAGLPAALRDAVRTTAARAGLTADLDVDGWPADLRTPVDGLLYRTACELLGNVAKHARAGRLVVTLALVGDTARLTVADDGVGVGARTAWTSATASARATSGWRRTRCASRRRAGRSPSRPAPPPAPWRRSSYPCRRQVGRPPTRTRTSAGGRRADAERGEGNPRAVFRRSRRRGGSLLVGAGLEANRGPRERGRHRRARGLRPSAVAGGHGDGAVAVVTDRVVERGAQRHVRQERKVGVRVPGPLLLDHTSHGPGGIEQHHERHRADVPGAVDLPHDDLRHRGRHLRNGHRRGQRLPAAAGGETVDPVELGAGVFGVGGGHPAHGCPEHEVAGVVRGEPGRCDGRGFHDGRVPLPSPPPAG